MVKRKWVQVGSLVVANSYYLSSLKFFPCPILNCYACPVAIFACPIGTIQHFFTLRQFLGFGLHMIPFFTFGVLILVGAIIGRMTCGWICPFGFLQELLYKIPTKKIKIPPKFTNLRFLILLSLVIIIPLLTFQPWFCKVCPVGTLEAGIPQVLLDPDLRELIGFLFYIKLAILAITIALVILYERAFCKLFCPLGAIFSPFNRASAYRLRVNVEKCNQCNVCFKICPMDIKVYEEANSGACIRCLKCTKCKQIKASFK